jgi:hypothetical protein
MDTLLGILCLSGSIPRDKAMNASQLFDDARAMIWRLLNLKK